MGVFGCIPRVTFPGKVAITNLVAAEYITRPVPEAPLFGLPAEPGVITDVGRSLLWIGRIGPDDYEECRNSSGRPAALV